MEKRIAKYNNMAHLYIWFIPVFICEGDIITNFKILIGTIYMKLDYEHKIINNDYFWVVEL